MQLQESKFTVFPHFPYPFLKIPYKNNQNISLILFISIVRQSMLIKEQI